MRLTRCPTSPRLRGEVKRAKRVRVRGRGPLVSATPLTPTLIGARLRFDVAADSSPPPCGEGSGVGVGRCGTSVLHGTTPHPIPPPPGGGGSLRPPFGPLTPPVPSSAA